MSHVEWKRKYVTKYSDTVRMKNGLRKTYSSVNNCNHDPKTYKRINCSICDEFIKCCDKCHTDFSEDNVEVENWNDLICPDCLESCEKCKTIIAHDNGDRSEVYPHNFYCSACFVEEEKN